MSVDRFTLLRASLPAAGDLSGEWYRADEPDQLDLAVLRAAGSTGLECELVYDSGPAGRPAYLLMVSFAVPSSEMARFDDWYDSEHSPLLLNAASWLRIRRFRAVETPAGEQNCFVLHELADLAVLEGPDRDAAVNGPKRAVVASLPWYASSRRCRFTPLGEG